jgi:hypothetical protein
MNTTPQVRATVRAVCRRPVKADARLHTRTVQVRFAMVDA